MSDAELTFGITIASKFGAFNYHIVSNRRIDIANGGHLTTSVKSFSANPLSTELMRTARSLIPSGLGSWRKSRSVDLASAFRSGVTESSKSYATVSTLKPLDLSKNLLEDPGTVCSISQLSL